MRIEAGVATDIGRVREGNEDSYLVEPPLYAVADGMGGHRGGEVASQLALETVEELARHGTGTLADQVRGANRAVFEKSQQDTAVTGMGTTLTAAVIEGPAAHLAHVGDSRAYLLRAGSLRQLTEDHTLVNRMVKAGEITRAEAEVHPHRNVVTRALGTEAEVTVDEDDVSLMDGDRMLLCSDGLFAMVAEDQIQAILEADPDPQKAADRLIRAANRAGGIDNITVVVLEAHDDDDGDVPARAGGGGPADRAMWRWVVGAVVALVILTGAVFAGRAWVDGRWYVGAANGHVAVYQGVPAEPLGIHLSHVELETDLLAAEVQKLELYRNLADGINADDRAAADAIVAAMRTDLKASRHHKGVGGP
jgi:serine/threonine protein phosphatase PrpC